MLAIGPSTIPYCRGNDNRGLFTTLDVTRKGTILCIKKGIILNESFWSFSDYSTRDIRIISSIDKLTTFLLDKDNSVSYLDFIKDPLNTKLVNAELTESVKDGMVVLKTTTEILANSELFISFGKESWIAEFRSCEWSLTNNLYNTMVKQSMLAYHIDKSEITKAALDNQTSQIIQNYIESHMSWQNSTNHSSVNVLVYKQNSCYINSVLQCLARIPALTQLLLNTNLFENMDDSTFLHKYINLIKKMTNKKESWTEMRKWNNLILDFRTGINPAFIPGTQWDAPELYESLLNKFCEENQKFEFVKHHLFCFYREVDTTCSNGHHKVSLRNEYLLNLPIENCKQTTENSSLYSRIIYSMKIRAHPTGLAADKKQYTQFKCAECIYHKLDYTTSESYKILHMPNILVIQLHRFYFDSNSMTTEFDNTIVAFDKYLTLPEGDSVVHYELIGLITYIGNASHGHYLAYVVDPSNQWWLLNDLPRAHQEPTCDPEQVDASDVYSEKKTAYVFFYRKISGINNDKIINMLKDCYGQND